VLDLETTGTHVDHDRIVQIAITMHSATKPPIAWKSLVNPGVDIHADAIAVHGIKNDDVKDAPTFRTMAPKLFSVLVNCDFCGYNVEFDLKMLRSEFRRAGRDWDWEQTGDVIDAYRIYQIAEPRRLSDAYERFLGKKFEDAHDAGADVEAATDILAHQLQEFTDIPRTVSALSAYCFPRNPNFVDKRGKIVWRGNEACINFGRHSGTSLRLMEKGYLTWMLNGDFPADTKDIIRKAAAGEYPERKSTESA